MIDKIEVDIFGKIFTDSFSYIRIDFILIKDSGFFIFFKYGTISIDTPDFDVWIFLFQIFCSTANCSACTNTYNKMRDLSICLIPDLRTGLFVMPLLHSTDYRIDSDRMNSVFLYSVWQLQNNMNEDLPVQHLLDKR